MAKSSDDSVCVEIPFHSLCSLCENISHAAKEKRGQLFDRFLEYFRNYFKSYHADDANTVDSFYPILRLLLPQLDRDRGAYGVKEHTLAKIYIRILCLPKDGQDAARLLNYRSFHSAGKDTGDFADVAYFVLKDRCPKAGCLKVKQVNDHLDNLAKFHAEHEPRKVDQELMLMLRAMSALEQKWLIRMLLKDMKIGMGSTAIFNHFHPDARELYDVSNNLEKVCKVLSDPSVRLHEIEVSLFDPFRPMLSDRCDILDVEKMLKRQTFYVETKHDGERFQLHMKNGVFKYFSRNGNDYTDTFGATAKEGLLTKRIAKRFSSTVTSCILDGEMVVWIASRACFGTKGENFDVKNLKPDGDYRPCFCVFDILLLNGRVLTNKPLRDRLACLEGLFEPEEGLIGFTARKNISSKEDALTALNDAIDNREEGIILKDPDSVYKPNVRKGGWLKIKPEYTDQLMDQLDLLIIGGYFGKGRRQGIVSHFLMAAAVPPEEEGKNPKIFHAITRIGSGYTDKELDHLLSLLRAHWQPVKSKQPPKEIVWTKERPDVWVSPRNSYVLQVKATEFIPSDSYPTDFTLRFPRVEKVRYDKSWYDCTTLDELEELRKRGSGKLYSRKLDVTEEVSPTKRQRKQHTMDVGVSLAGQFRPADVSSIEQTSKLLDGKEICVMSDCGEKSKQDLEKMIVQYGGTVLQHPGENTFCVLAERENLRIKNITRAKRYDVVKPDWLLRSISSEKILSWSPADVLSVKPETEDRMKSAFDEFGDSYTEPSTLQSLKFAMSQAKAMHKDVRLSPGEMGDLDVELFDGPSPFAIFRTCVAYFVSDEEHQNLKDVLLRHDFKCQAGRISNSLEDPLLTHVIITSRCCDGIPKVSEVNRRRKKKFLIVSEAWITESLGKNKRLDEDVFFPYA